MDTFSVVRDVGVVCQVFRLYDKALESACNTAHISYQQHNAAGSRTVTADGTSVFYFVVVALPTSCVECKLDL